MKKILLITSVYTGAGHKSISDALAEQFEREKAEIIASSQNKWDRPYVAVGIAVYDPEVDDSVSATMRRADKKMYENKRTGKGQ